MKDAQEQQRSSATPDTTPLRRARPQLRRGRTNGRRTCPPSSNRLRPAACEDRHRRDPPIFPCPDAETLRSEDVADPDRRDVVTAADALLPLLRALRESKLTPATVIVPSWQRDRVTQREQYQQFRDSISAVLNAAERVREDADIAHVEWQTVAVAFHQVQSPLTELERITAGPLEDRIEEAEQAAQLLAATAEAVHSRGCLLGSSRTRLAWGYSDCAGGEVRVKLRIFDEETTVTAPGCPRHAAEEIVYRDSDVEYGYTRVEILGGTDEDLDAIYDLADEVRRERRRVAREREANPRGAYPLPVPPWMRRQ